MAMFRGWLAHSRRHCINWLDMGYICIVRSFTEENGVPLTRPKVLSLANGEGGGLTQHYTRVFALNFIPG